MEILEEGENNKADDKASYSVELAKSSRAVCRRCESLIEKNTLRIGIVTEGAWGLFTRWQHLQCTVFDKDIGLSDVEGFLDLSQENRSLTEKRLNDSLNELDQDKIPVDPDELVRTSWSVAKEPSEDLLLPLLEYQKEGLGWMLHQETESDILGGILADEMGMGKTVQAIALILDNRPLPSDAIQKNKRDDSDLRHGYASSSFCKQIAPKPESSKQRGESKAPTRKPAASVTVASSTTAEPSDLLPPLLRGGTLLVLPTVAIAQWHTEIARFTKKGSLVVKVYHGSNRDATVEELAGADVVITSYNILEIEYRKATAGTKVQCRICDRKFYPDKLRVHRKYFCGENAQRTEKQAKTEKTKTRVGSKKRSRDDDEDEDSDDDDDDDITLQKASKNGKKDGKKPLKLSQSSRSKPIKAVDDDGDDVGKQKRPSLKATKKGGNAKKHNKLSQSSSSKPNDNDGEYEESESDEDDGDEEDHQMSKSSKRKKLIVEDDDDDDDLLSVEEDIRAALKQAAKTAPTSSLLHMISWFRVILDEAHMIKDRSTSTAKAVFNLVSLHKWCLTGTPLQNRVSELYSLVRFLRIDPHAFYFCKAKSCSCKSLHYRFSAGRCDDCSHSAMQHFCFFNRHILNPIKKSGYIADGRKAMLKLKEQVLDEILLRRTKTSRAEDIPLPARVVRVRRAHLDAREEDFYEALYTQSQARFDTYVQSGTVLNNYAHIFEILMKLRQAVNHPYLVLHSNSSEGRAAVALSDGSNATLELLSKCRAECGMCGLLEESGDSESQICVAQCCGLNVCRDCVQELLNSSKELTTAATTSKRDDSRYRQTKSLCPQCSSPFTIDMSSSSNRDENWPSHSVWDSSKKRRGILEKIDLGRFQSSTKMEGLMEELHHMREADPTAKAIVFSQFVNMLDLLDYRIQKGGFGCVKLLGGLNPAQKEKVISSFKEDPNISIMLISLQAGGVALNLTVASHVFLMDPWWNPASEMQAIDRTHRIGQHKPIYATRFIIENTVEEKILKLQEKKRLVFDGTVGGDSSSMARLTLDDMRFLFH